MRSSSLVGVVSSCLWLFFARLRHLRNETRPPSIPFSGPSARIEHNGFSRGSINDRAAVLLRDSFSSTTCGISINTNVSHSRVLQRTLAMLNFFSLALFFLIRQPCSLRVSLAGRPIVRSILSSSEHSISRGHCLCSTDNISRYVHPTASAISVTTEAELNVICDVETFRRRAASSYQRHGCLRPNQN